MTENNKEAKENNNSSINISINPKSLFLVFVVVAVAVTVGLFAYNSIVKPAGETVTKRVAESELDNSALKWADSQVQKDSVQARKEMGRSMSFKKPEVLRSAPSYEQFKSATLGLGKNRFNKLINTWNNVIDPKRMVVITVEAGDGVWSSRYFIIVKGDDGWVKVKSYF